MRRTRDGVMKRRDEILEKIEELATLAEESRELGNIDLARHRESTKDALEWVIGAGLTTGDLDE